MTAESGVAPPFYQNTLSVDGVKINRNQPEGSLNATESLEAQSAFVTHFLSLIKGVT